MEASFRLPQRFSVPDLLSEREVKNWGGEALLGLGLSVEELAGDGVQHARTYRQQTPALSLPDCFALTLAQIRVLGPASDGALCQLAAAEAVECHGVLWLLDEMHAAAVVSIRELPAGLTALAKHPRCRLPKPAIRRRLASYAARLG